MVNKKFVITYNVWSRAEPTITVNSEKVLVSGIDEFTAIRKFKSLHAPTCQVLEALERIE